MKKKKKERIQLNKEIKLDEHEIKNEENNPSIIDKEKLRSEKKPMIKKKTTIWRILLYKRWKS